MAVPVDEAIAALSTFSLEVVVNSVIVAFLLLCIVDFVDVELSQL